MAVHKAMVCAASLVLGLTPATGQPVSLDDPARVVAGDAQDMFAQVFMNGADTGLVIQFSRRGTELFASSDDLRTIGLDIHANSASVPLSQLPGVSAAIDDAAQVVYLQVGPDALAETELGVQQAGLAPTKAAWGALVNYSAYVDRSSYDTGGGASLEGRLFGPVGAFSTTALLRADGGRLGFRRLETSFISENSLSMRRLTIGDFISPDGGAGGAVRGAGVQLSTDFGLRPDLMTAPMPHLRGSSGVPSSVDVYVDGVKRLSRAMGAGRFAINQTPVVDGAGRVSLVVRDITGRETVQSLTFYGASQLLRPGLTATSFQAGLVRKDAFGDRDQYGDFFASGAVRRGLTDHVTGEVRAAVTSRTQTAGATFTTKLGEFALLSSTVDVSTGDRGRGAQFSLSARRDAGRLSAYLAVQRSVGAFRPLSALAGAPVTTFQLQAGGSVRSRDFGSLAVSVTQVRTRFFSSRVLAGSWSRHLGPRLSAFVNVSQSRFERSEILAAAGITLALSGRSSSSAQIAKSAAGWRQDVSWSQAAPYEGGLSLRAAASGGDNDRLLGGASYRGRSGEAGFDVALNDGRASARAYASGSMVWLGGAPRLAAHLGSSFALVDTGQANVGIRVENRMVGRTDRHGRILISDLPAFSSTRIAVDIDRLDMGFEAAADEVLVRPPSRAGAIIPLAVRRIRALTLSVVDEGGRPLPLGAIVRRPGGLRDVVGYDGMTYLRDVPGALEAEVTTPTGTCRLSLDGASTDRAVCYAR